MHAYVHARAGDPSAPMHGLIHHRQKMMANEMVVGDAVAELTRLQEAGVLLTSRSLQVSCLLHQPRNAPPTSARPFFFIAI